MSEKTYRILTLNPGSTSTKVGVFENHRAIATHTIRHAAEEFADFASVLDQKETRVRHVLDFLEANGIDGTKLDAAVGRGGIIKPIDSGTYNINAKMLEDLHRGAASSHASSLGAIIAAEMGARFGIPAYTVDPVVVDEMEQVAKMTGIPGIERRSVFHALNTKAVARKCAAQLGLAYEDGRFIVAHMGGGISVGAHRYGRVIDVNDGISGEGPFTPERCGSVPAKPLIEMCFSGHLTKEELLALTNKNGGLVAYLGTNDMTEVERMVQKGDEFAALVMDSMAYQIAKEIGAMAAALEGRINAIILTGGLAYSTRFTGAIKQRVDPIARVMTYPGEDEMTALADGALRVLNGSAKALEYK